MKTLAQKARQLRDLLANKRRWTQGSTAINSADLDVSPSDPAACKFCLIGGIARVEGLNDRKSNCWPEVVASDLGKLVGRVIQDARGGSDRQVVAQTLYLYNDDMRHEDVMGVLHMTVAHAEGAGV